MIGSTRECRYPRSLSGGVPFLMFVAQGAGNWERTFDYEQQFPQKAKENRLFFAITAGGALSTGSCVSHLLINRAKVTERTAMMVGLCSYIAGLALGSFAVLFSRACNGPD